MTYNYGEEYQRLSPGDTYQVAHHYCRTFFNRFDDVMVVVDVVYPDVNAFWGHIQGEPEWKYLIPVRILERQKFC